MTSTLDQPVKAATFQGVSLRRKVTDNIATVLVTASVVVALVLRRWRTMHPLVLAWLVILTGLALWQRRQLGLFGVGVPLLLAPYIGGAEAWLRRGRSIRAFIAPLALAAITAFLQITGANGNGGGWPGYGRNCAVLPCITADFLASNPVPQPIFNSYNQGGYLLHVLYPGAKVFIDGRLDVYPSQVWLDMLAVEEGRLKIDDLVARYGIKTEGLDGFGVIEGVAQRRAFRVRGGDYDYEKAAHVLLQDYRQGALGRISLETPQTRAEALERHRIEMEEKARIAAEKAARKAEEAARGKRGT